MVDFLSLFVTHVVIFGTPIDATDVTRNKVVKTLPCPGLKNGMDYVRLGDSDLVVSRVCMGTMTFGEQNTLEEGVEQLCRAFDHYGINFLGMFSVCIQARQI